MREGPSVDSTWHRHGLRGPGVSLAEDRAAFYRVRGEAHPPRRDGRPGRRGGHRGCHLEECRARLRELLLVRRLPPGEGRGLRAPGDEAVRAAPPAHADAGPARVRRGRRGVRGGLGLPAAGARRGQAAPRCVRVGQVARRASPRRAPRRDRRGAGEARRGEGAGGGPRVAGPRPAVGVGPPARDGDPVRLGVLDPPRGARAGVVVERSGAVPDLDGASVAAQEHLLDTAPLHGFPADGEILGARADSTNLDGEELATLESLAENLSDGFAAPLFWYCCCGPTGALLYRVVNTLDSTIGYRGRFEWFGKPSARLDDVINLIPARITAVLLIIAAGISGSGDAKAGWRVARADSKLTASPNAGWPMSCLAGLLAVKLEKPKEYPLNKAGSRPDGSSIKSGNKVVHLAAAIARAAAKKLAGLSSSTSTSGSFIVRGLTGPKAHLNGEIGYTLSIRLGDDLWKKACVSHYGVHFENAELGECKILSAGNLRLLFDLPDERPRPDCG
ncbi:hypothetical protein THAOC_18527 [Thalassiosira oceanica]|uniref:Cobalamin biosynthesis protein CobD n=1 Tax=Thalassiosira oceanica TaxID=159749 RepID=K0SRT2_THAOC|nr:hypothetical protein THAOC_18527 [Thalassiosira oceanica]|eukprot:EJK61042.1 hypothetical protein THAOC_18527 [Thalassiosira oceanica]